MFIRPFLTLSFLLLLLLNSLWANSPSSSLSLISFYNAPLKELNFGVVVNNPYYKIYRSEGLGEKGLEQLQAHLTKNSLPFPKTIIHMNRTGFISIPFIKTAYAVEEFLAQKKYDFHFFHPYNFSYRTYLDGQNPYAPTDIIDDWSSVTPFAKQAIDLLKINNVNNNPTTVEGGIEAMHRILALVLDPKNSPVLFHCDGGRHRTGMTAMLIRYIQGGEWTDLKKKKYRIFLGSFNQKEQIVNKAQLEYYLHNDDMFRQMNLDFVENFSAHDPDFQKLIYQYRELLNY